MIPDDDPDQAPLRRRRPSTGESRKNPRLKNPTWKLAARVGILPAFVVGCIACPRVGLVFGREKSAGTNDARCRHAAPGCGHG